MVVLTSYCTSIGAILEDVVFGSEIPYGEIPNSVDHYAKVSSRRDVPHPRPGFPVNDK